MEVAFLPLGGSTLKQWVEAEYLKDLDKSEVHIYDRDGDNLPQYQDACNKVNARDSDCWATLTSKRSIENYLHPDAIQEVLGVRVSYGDNDNVIEIVAKAKWESDNQGRSWENNCSKKNKGILKTHIKTMVSQFSWVKRLFHATLQNRSEIRSDWTEIANCHSSAE